MGIEVKGTGAGFSLSWPDYSIVGKVTRLREEKHNLRGEISLWRMAGEKRLDLYQDTVNFDSARSKTAALKILAPFGENGWEPDWVVLLGTLWKQVPAQYRQGAPLLILAGDRDDYPIELRYLVKPLLFLREPTLCFGLGGAAKGWVATIICMLVSTGESRYGLSVPNPATIFYLDWESTETELNRRIALLKAGGLAVDAHIPYRRCAAPLADDLEDILDMARGVGAEGVVIDSLLGACGEDLEKNQGASRFFRAFRSLGLAGFIITHTQKNTKEQDRSAFGSAYWSNQARSVWQASSVSEPGGNQTVVGLIHTKVNMGRLHKPFALRFTFTPDPNDPEHDLDCRVSAADPEDVPATAKAKPLRFRIADFLKGVGAKEAYEIAEALGHDAESITTILYKEKKLFVHLPGERGKAPWGLLSPES